MKQTEYEKRKLIDNNARILVKNFLTTIGTHIAEIGEKKDLWDYGIMALMKEVVDAKALIELDMHANQICACCGEYGMEINCSDCPVMSYLD